jgi:S-adenosylmethionine:tRNA ribosyltransferase-isomerase
MAERRWTTADFDYPLPEDLIAQVPSNERGGSRLLVVDPCEPTPSPLALRDTTFSQFPDLLAPGDMVVVNSTRVRHARLLGTRPSGKPAELLLLHPTSEGNWLAMGKPGKALQVGKRITLGKGIEVETIAIDDDGFREVRFLGGTAEQAIDDLGQLPLPPYITRAPSDDDETRYQTVYARREGSVAAPTAGLHFTGDSLLELERRGIRVVELDLEVGPGTFRPVEAEDPALHRMHTESFEIPVSTAKAIAETRSGGGRIWAVGTTVVRALESAADLEGRVSPGRASTNLMILPGYPFRVVDGLLTNFHLPRSTLMMLVAAFAGYDTTMSAYRHAVGARYRFYSYGDAMCIVSRAT